MKFLILSQGADGVGLALRLHAEGNECRVFIRETETEDRGKGLIDTTSDPSWGEVIVADCTGMGGLCDRFREHGAKVCCGSSLADKLETDRAFSQEVMERCGIETPESQSFNDWETAEAFIAASKDRLVFKPEGKLSGIIPSYCAKDNQELLESLDHFKTICGQTQPEFTLQQFIEGVCVSTEGWFDGHRFTGLNRTIERKHFLNGDIGPSGGCTGNLVWPVGFDDPIAQRTVLKLEGFLAEHDYRGPIDVNAVVNDEGVYGLEFTPRMGYDAFPTLLYGLYTGEFGAFLYGLSIGEAPEAELAERFAAGIRLSIPPWPTEKFKAEKGIPIRGLSPHALIDRFYPYDVELSEDRLVTSGGFGIVGVMNAYSDSVEDAFRKAYRRVRRVQVPDIQYRTDLGEVCAKDYAKLSRIVSAVSV